jgi:hypothetical protein
MSTARLILCEKSSRWAVALRRTLGPDQHVLRQTRSLAECGRELAAAPASLVAIECTDENLDKAVLAINEWATHYPHARFAAVFDSSLAAAEPLLREAGAAAVIDSPRQALALARLALGHVARAPAGDLPLVESIRQRLPWARWAAASGTA